MVQDNFDHVHSVYNEAKRTYIGNLYDKLKREKRLTTTTELGITYALTKDPEKGFRITSFTENMEPMGHEAFKDPQEAVEYFVTQHIPIEEIRQDFPNDLLLAFDNYNYIYQATRRPIGPGAIPRDNLVETREGGNFGIAVYDIPLSERTLEHYDLEPIGYEEVAVQGNDVQDKVNAVNNLFSQYLDKKSKPNVTPTVYVNRDDVRIETMFGRQAIMLGPQKLPGVTLTKDQLPTILFHVTTNAEAVINSSILKSMHESSAPGLGKGVSEAHQGVSLTTNYHAAILIQIELKRHIEIARGNVTDYTATLNQWAREDEEMHGLIQGEVQPAVDQAVYWLQFQESTGDKITPSTLQDAMRQYYIERENRTQIDNPILLGNIKRFADIDPDNVGVIRVYKHDIPDNALIRDPEINLDEVMVHSDIPVRPMLQSA